MIKTASIGKRILSFIIDIILLELIIANPLIKLIGHSGFKVEYTSNTVFIVFSIFILAWFYFSLMQYVLGQTLGMMLLNIKIENNTLLRSFTRNLFFIPVFPITILIITEPLYLLWKKKRLLEELTGTYTYDIGGATYG